MVPWCWGDVIMNGHSTDFLSPGHSHAWDWGSPCGHSPPEAEEEAWLVGSQQEVSMCVLNGSELGRLWPGMPGHWNCDLE